MSRSERIAQQLGMSHGAAAGKLRKKILFSLLVRLQENICFKCGKVIETDDELSIEHKQPWENRRKELFWDLGNIAFSHCLCNVPHVFGAQGKPSSRRKIGPEGTSWCIKHQQFLSVDMFHKDVNAWNGLQGYCKECHHSVKGRDM